MVAGTNSHQIGDVRIFGISGRLSIGNTLQSIEQALEALIREGTKKLVIDVSSLSSIDSAGVGTLLMIAGEIEHAGGAMKIAGATGVVHRTFNTVHLERVVDQQPDVESAVRAFG